MQTKLSSVRAQGQIASLDAILRVVQADYQWNEGTKLEDHKATEIAKARRKSVLWPWQKQIAKCADIVSHVFAIAIGLGILGFVASILALAFGAPNSGISTLYCAFTVVIAIGICVVTLYVRDRRIYGPAEWKKTKNYYGFVPDRAKDLERDIKALLPRCDFFHLELVQDNKVIDPILMVSAMNHVTNRYEYRAVLVWDEAGKIIAPPT
jgi:hypothetical protein